ncbi:MAG: clostripain-related cysteine peptidase [Candidatus Eremiobacteraeota bacterium]|nr:clostripain-related cysteine peptidase [Candidatus Eremiobacteraeota bacterium]
MTIRPAAGSPLYEQQAAPSQAPVNKEEGAQAQSDSISLGQEPQNPVGDKKKWGVMLYSGADNNLESDMVQDVIDLESVGSDKNTHVLVQLDRGESPSSISGEWAGCRRLYLNKGTDSSNLTSPVIQDMGQVNMGDAKTLTDFIVWGVQNYPAEHYMLILSDHGGGWPGAISDDSHGGWIKTPDLNKALEEAEKITGKKIDLLGFDACLMASTEVGYELKDSAGYMVASENTEGADGWPYPQIFTSKIMKNLQRALREKLDITPEEVAKKVVEEAQGFQGTLPTLSAMDLSKMKDLAAATDAFAQKLIATDTPKYAIQEAARASQSFSGFKDQFDFAEMLVNSKDVKDEELKAAAKTMMSAIKGAVIAEEHSSSKPGAHGLTIELPSYPSDPSEDYKELKFAKDTAWDEALGKMK